MSNQEKDNQMPKSLKAKTITLSIIVLILVLILGVLAGVVISGKGDTVINKTQEIIKGEENNKDSKTYNLSQDYIARWSDKDDANSIWIKSIDGNTIKFDFAIFRIASFDDIKADLISDSEATFKTDKEKDGMTLEGKLKFESEKVKLEITKSDSDLIENGFSQEYKYKNIKAIDENVEKNGASQNNANTKNVSSESIWYTCDAFKIKLPKSWENKYKVDIGDLGEEDGGDSYNFRIISDDEYLFSIEVRNTELKADFIPHEFLGSYTEGNNIKYVYMIYRSDAPANEEPHTSMMKDFENYKDDVYVKQTFGNKTFYAKDFLKIEKGSMYRYYRYYIDENDRLCILNYENNITIDIIADHTDKLTYDEKENVIHAYPIGKSFMNNINRDVDEIIFENLN